MSDDGPPILAYAMPRGALAAAAAIDAPDDRCVFTFASPPAQSRILSTIAVFVVCAFGAVIVGALCLQAYREQRDGFGFRLFFTGFALALMAGLIVCGYRDLRRLRKYGHQDVRFEIRGDELLAWSPQQWGPEPRAVKLEQIRGEIRVTASADIGLVRIFEIHIRRGLRFIMTWTIPVAVADRGVINREIADLNAAVARARARAIGEGHAGGHA
jgi:hypothetical protein